MRLIPVANFNAYFGTTTFGKKYNARIPPALVEFDLPKYDIARAKLGETVRKVL